MGSFIRNLLFLFLICLFIGSFFPERAMAGCPIGTECGEVVPHEESFIAKDDIKVSGSGVYGVYGLGTISSFTNTEYGISASATAEVTFETLTIVASPLHIG